MLTGIGTRIQFQFYLYQHSALRYIFLLPLFTFSVVYTHSIKMRVEHRHRTINKNDEGNKKSDFT